MNRRLQQFLELENLSPARLADMLGVQRSGVSHILSGRNKPGFDFIQKLLTKFPSLSADWFLTGKGKPYKEMNIQGGSTTFQNNNSGNYYGTKMFSKFFPASCLGHFLSSVMQI